jgi:hypothetical protein
MHRMRAILSGVIVLGAMFGSAPGFAGTVITSNLPPNTAIININARQDGAAVYNGVNYALWYQPFDSGGSNYLPEYTVQPGTYTFRIVNPPDAARLFPSLTAAQTNQIFTAWTYNTPWSTDYLAFDSAALTNNALSQLFDGAFGADSGNADSAYAAAISSGSYVLIHTGPAGRNSTVATNLYTFSAAATLVFVIPDYGLGDNNGGVSVLIAPAGPELTIAPDSGSGSVTLQWPSSAAGYDLEEESPLQPGAWSVVPNAPTLSNTNYSVTLPLGLSNTFFRLHHP